MAVAFAPMAPQANYTRTPREFASRPTAPSCSRGSHKAVASSMSGVPNSRKAELDTTVAEVAQHLSTVLGYRP
jgi:hypothetical protein